MDNRKKRGIGYMISGVVFLAVGGAMVGTDVTPEWLSLVVQGVGLIANMLGFATVFPDD